MSSFPSFKYEKFSQLCHNKYITVFKTALCFAFFFINLSHRVVLLRYTTNCRSTQRIDLNLFPAIIETIEIIIIRLASTLPYNFTIADKLNYKKKECTRVARRTPYTQRRNIHKSDNVTIILSFNQIAPICNGII